MRSTVQSIIIAIGLLVGYYQDPIILKPHQEDKVKAIIFDLDGVLLTTSKKMYTKITPYFPLYAARAMYDRRGLHVKEHYLEILSQVPGRSQQKSFHQGKPMPQIMVDWQTGTDVYETVTTEISENKSLPYAYKKLMLAIAENVFNPQKFINSRTPIKSGIKLLKSLKKAGYKLYVLSNWDRQSFPLLKEKQYKLFEFVDGSFTSGEAGMLKPNPEIFNAFLNKFNLKASECVLIDDEQHNVDGAESVGIRSVRFDKKKSTDAIKKLQKLLTVTKS